MNFVQDQLIKTTKKEQFCITQNSLWVGIKIYAHYNVGGAKQNRSEEIRTYHFIVYLYKNNS